MGGKPPLELTGQIFGRLRAIERTRSNEYGYYMWRCICQCGKEVEVIGSSLKCGNTQSCGCLFMEVLQARNTKHCGSGTPEWIAWAQAYDRCENPKNKRYQNYNGRGIKMCVHWRENFAHFLKDMGPKPGPEHSLDRINNNGDYEPGNCRWATRKEQARNRTICRFYEMDGRSLTLPEWGEIIGIPPNRLRWLRDNITRHKISLEEAVRRLSVYDRVHYGTPPRFE